MQPQTPLPTPPPLLEYFDPAPRWKVTRLRIARCFSGALTASAFALLFGAIAQGWVQNPVLELGVLLLAAVGALLVLRTLNLCQNTFRFGWISAVVVFGLWTA